MSDNKHRYRWKKPDVERFSQVMHLKSLTLRADCSLFGSGSLLVNVELVFCEKPLLRSRIERKNSLVFAAESDIF